MNFCIKFRMLDLFNTFASIKQKINKILVATKIIAYHLLNFPIE